MMFAGNFMKSVVADTNVFVSALTGGKTCKQIIDLFKTDAFEALTNSLVFVIFSPKEVTTYENHDPFTQNRKNFNSISGNLPG